MRFRLMALVVAILGVFGPVGIAPSAWAAPEENPDSSRDSLLFIGMSGIRPSDIDFSSRELSRLLSLYSFAALSPRSVSPLTCPSEGWMQLRTSRDVSDRLPESFVVALGDECHSAGIVEDPASLYDAYPQTVHIRNFALRLGETEWPEQSLFSADVTAMGTNATIPVASHDGTVSQWFALPDGGAPENAAHAQEELQKRLETAPGDVVVDLGSVRGSPRYLDIATQIPLIEQKLINLLEANERSAHPRRVMIASLGDQWRRAHLHFFATNLPLASQNSASQNNATAAESTLGTIRSQLTRADGFITIADVRNMISGKYSGLTVRPTDSITAAMKPVLDVTRHAYVAASSSAKWYQVFNTVVLLGFAGVFVMFLAQPARQGHRWGAPNRLWSMLEQFNLWAFAWVPAAMILNFLPWWELPGKPGAMQAWAIVMTSLIAVALVALSHLTPHRAGFIALVAFTILSLDIIAGSPHQRNGFMGSLILTSRRYYGVSNRTYLILVACGLVAGLVVWAWLRYRKNRRLDADAHRPLPLVVFAILGVVALAVDALPLWGADFGGPPGLMAGFGVAIVLLAGWRLRWWHGAVWLALTVAVMFAVGLVDAKRGGESHIGRFWAKFGSAESWALVAGKIRDVTRSFVQRPDLLALIAIAIVVAVGAVYATRRLNEKSGVHLDSLREMTCEPGFIPVAIGIAVGILVAVPINDSGAIMIKEGLYISLPALAAMVAGQAARRPILKEGFEDGGTPVVVDVVRHAVGRVAHVVRRVAHRDS